MKRRKAHNKVKDNFYYFTIIVYASVSDMLIVYGGNKLISGLH